MNTEEYSIKQKVRDIYRKKTQKTVGISGKLRKAVSSGSVYAIMPYVRCGFELETLSVDNKTYENLEIDRSDAKRLLSPAKAAYARMTTEKIIKKPIVNLDENEFTVVENITFALSGKERELVWKDTHNLHEDPFSECEDSFLDIFRKHSVYRDDHTFLRQFIIGYFGIDRIHDFPEDLFPSPETLIGEKAKNLDATLYFKQPNWTETMECVRDGTVPGPEIRTIGGLKVGEFLKASKSLNSDEIKVNSKCSFHIHVSVDGLDISEYDKDFHAALWEGLIRQFHNVPKSVKKRWLGSYQSQYYKKELGEERYNAVAWRDETIEFRLFGNIKRYKSHARCLLIAIKAVRWAIRATLGLETRTIDAKTHLSYASTGRKVHIHNVIRSVMDLQSSSYEKDLYYKMGEKIREINKEMASRVVSTANVDKNPSYKAPTVYHVMDTSTPNWSGLVNLEFNPSSDIIYTTVR